MEKLKRFSEDFSDSRDLEKVEGVCNLAYIKHIHDEDKLQRVFFVVSKETNKGIRGFINNISILFHS